ncbi:mandelate racemase/muconate lactonizing enzyme family protein [Chelativorans sp. YIM 93263]|uniref:mandelate racemase/muconate lactonizing enzyme family protein n=1 Tax=Chelativorans sp. YIM 93263 TaxID=2906648 RepID=UPI00237941B9|nr:mandelate racemase/muconate lactonizing enzyme family protein [Chelativorans sp. YIM 93263]
MDQSVEIAALEAHVLRVPIDNPVVTSFGEMHSRPAVFVEVKTRDGFSGWGEVWCNFPTVGAAHRARLVQSVLTPLLVGETFETPRDAFAKVTARTEVLAIQSGEPGPLAQVIAGVDIALWDLVARRAELPLYRLFTEREVESLPVYASGLNASQPEKLAEEKHAEGHRRFKLKVGFGRERDVRNLETLRAAFGAETPLMVDANQAWTAAEALEMSRILSEFDPLWLEEPLRADAPLADWRALAENSPIALALGENLRGDAAFAEMTNAGVARYVQPDIAKWGGFSGCIPVGGAALDAGLTVCPHWLGGGIGLIASWHLLAALGGDGLLEVDSNPNPLRDDISEMMPAISSGEMRAPDGFGLGIQPNIASLYRA